MRRNVKKYKYQGVKKREKIHNSDTGRKPGSSQYKYDDFEALEHLENRENIFFVHQTGAKDETQVKQKYNGHGIENDTRAFFKDMARQYQKADLIICRAGATTVAEIKAIGKGVIFVPFPFAADNHQVLNARSLEKAGAAEMILEKDLSGKILAERINYYVQRPEALQQMALRSRDLGRVDAAAMIVDDCYDISWFNLSEFQAKDLKLENVQSPKVF